MITKNSKNGEPEGEIDTLKGSDIDYFYTIGSCILFKIQTNNLNYNREIHLITEFIILM